MFDILEVWWKWEYACLAQHQQLLHPSAYILTYLYCQTALKLLHEKGWSLPQSSNHELMCKSVNLGRLEISRFFWKFLFEGMQKNRRWNGSLMGWGIVGRDTPSGLFCIFQFELQIGGRWRFWNPSSGRLHKETTKAETTNCLRARDLVNSNDNKD